MRRGAVPGGAARGSHSALAAGGERGDPCLRRARPGRAPHRRSARLGIPGLETRPSVSHPRLSAAWRAPAGPRRPTYRLPARRLRTSQRSRYREETRACRCRGGAAGDYVKSPLSPVTLRCRCAGLSRDVLARAVARTGGGCGDARGVSFPPVISASLPPWSSTGSEDWEDGASSGKLLH